MKPANVVLLQGDSRISQSLLASFPNRNYSVHTARSLDELRIDITKHRAKAVVLDMEMVPLSEVAKLSHDFPGMRIVCNHRVADEEMWISALNAGASDVVPSCETNGILAAATGAFTKSVAA